MKKTCLSLMLLTLTTWAMAADINKNTQTAAQASAVANTFRIVTRPEIMGLWGMEIPTNRKCVEYYNFKSDNNVIIKSGDEWSSGIYDYQLPQDTTAQVPALILQVKYDNNQKDCSGNQEDQSGEVSQYFVKWQNPHTINFCATEKAEQCFATLRRILP
ncbi:hypothetical protein HADU_08156 [Acinetobacter sp. HA]|jgi:hypothetical protein|uniref:Uncharacterized protein n=4 Tax=Moraxellaceae TaxID=468 RepID=A0A1P8PJK4_9GAMM|nr:hypothetical protein AsACE_CH01305 [Acinetobacter schindleri]EIM39218.1 hypothetical protein HADU_08156 [Acinetobacter sp. HA]KMU98266.1 hypothetical protein ACS72_16755 [Acinetobacter sp. VT 511]OIJ38553.1 hypothetical protein BK820_05355 [Acinetobacter sp. LCT-H3]POU25232.1 hypothetical protein C3420_06355 [Acinetobacter sp. ACNIH3]POV75463.1 hypothetical protein C3421_13400 [Acinetobacter sp. ACNIH4]RAZ03215.1 hypothetical protein C8322_13310 [Acinetobacter sp. SM1B]